jgi:hypothetical protein
VSIEFYVRFGQALVNHAVDGFEKRSKEEIDYILTTHCHQCPFFGNAHCNHPGCGCNVNNEEKFLNKLAWASESCPAGHWRSGHITIPSGTILG